MERTFLPKNLMMTVFFLLIAKKMLEVIAGFFLVCTADEESRTSLSENEASLPGDVWDSSASGQPTCKTNVKVTESSIH